MILLKNVNILCSKIWKGIFFSTITTPYLRAGKSNPNHLHIIKALKVIKGNVKMNFSCNIKRGVLKPIWMELTLQDEVGNKIFTMLLGNLTYYGGRHSNHCETSECGMY